MKKFLTILTAVSLSFSASTSDIDKKLDLLLNKLDTLEKKLDQKDQEIEQLKQQLNIQQQEIKKQEIKTKRQLAVKSCDNLKVTDVNYKYYDNVIPYINFEVTLKNNYPYEITAIRGNIYFDDKDGTTLVKQYIDRKIDIKPGETVVIKGQHTVLTAIEKEMKDENPNNLKVYFSPNVVDFKNAPELRCY